MDIHNKMDDTDDVTLTEKRENGVIGQCLFNTSETCKNGDSKQTCGEKQLFLKPTVEFQSGYNDVTDRSVEKRAQRHRLLHTICVFSSIFSMVSVNSLPLFNNISRGIQNI